MPRSPQATLSQSPRSRHRKRARLCTAALWQERVSRTRRTQLLTWRRHSSLCPRMQQSRTSWLLSRRPLQTEQRRRRLLTASSSLRNINTISRPSHVIKSEARGTFVYHKKGRITRSYGRKHSVAYLFFLQSNDAHLQSKSIFQSCTAQLLCFTSSFCATSTTRDLKLLHPCLQLCVNNTESSVCVHPNIAELWWISRLTSIGKLSRTRRTVQLGITHPGPCRVGN
jgi:hypothetical protein